MPRFSVVVSAHDAPGGPAARTLDSVLAQPFGDVELIAVCDEPGTPSGRLVAALAERDGRVRAAHCPPRAGAGAARTTGMREAAGAHLLFLDGGDLLLPGALAALDARLRQTGPVDVLHFGYEREGTGPRPHPLPPAPAAAFAPDAAPHLTAVNRPVCGAAYRRGFLTVHQLAFPYGDFADVGWGGLVTVLAGRLAVLDSAVVRRGPAGRGPGDRLALLDQVELVLSWAAAEELSAGRSYALFDQLFAAVLRALPGVTSPRERRIFFHRARALYRRHRPVGHRAPDVRRRLLAAGAYPALRAADRLAARTAGPGGKPARYAYRAVATAARSMRSV
ncbi:glycosyltransferase [Streptomyces sp. NPDC006610]|uniref:glycosyltransferase family 2 protein n=1 Tax=Streptomyces sp. NPDC006610 TaxID=3154584 RepID=UPI0033BD3185